MPSSLRSIKFIVDRLRVFGFAVGGQSHHDFLQVVADRVGWEPRIELLAGEAFFLSRGHDVTVADQARRAIVIVGGDAENMRW